MSRSPGTPLAARELPALLIRVHAALAARREAIDELNVFPVPDGDTGTNMTLTVRAGLEGLRTAATSDPDAAGRAVIRGALRGARGNSGVILSQVLRAVIDVVTGHRRVDAALYAEALRRARDLAYESMAVPVEGTILSAIDAAADAAADAVEQGLDLVEVSGRVCAATAAAVERTRDQLDELRDAGVVDAGARGFQVLVAAVHGHLTGSEPPLVELTPPIRRGAPASPCGSSMEQPYEVQYLLGADESSVGPLRERLEQLGGSVAVVASGGLVNVHVHTAAVEPVIEAGLAHGTPSSIEVIDLRDEIARQRTNASDHAVVVPVVVVDGAGLTDLAHELGAVVVPFSDASAPSAEELTEVIRGSAAVHVIVLPGHPDVVPAALRASQLLAAHGVRCEVVREATNPPAVLAALAVMGPGIAPSMALAHASASSEAVRSGAVVSVMRDGDTPVGPVREGQYLAVVDDTPVTVSDEPVTALGRLASALRGHDAEVVTLLVGGEVPPGERRAAVALLEERTPADVEVVEAGQRSVRYWIGLE